MIAVIFGTLCSRTMLRQKMVSFLFSETQCSYQVSVMLSAIVSSLPVAAALSVTMVMYDAPAKYGR